ncbi:MAG: hypothetical protein WED09_06620 [Homoserinimonas sp.]
MTVAGLYVLARIYAWDIRVWRPKTRRRPALVVLNDPAMSSVNPRVVTQLLNARLVEEVNGTLVVTSAGARALLDRPEIILRMRASGAI